ncbi:MAG: MOSC domain-containing protein [Candidatus Nitrotoga sp.]|nr:MOSC domain-containing protein [Candidatus Nitrotoga sp.]MDO9448565.1 MOSC domain-containing protein [Candidatus Nitrotoga sp.]MDP1637365.1 MOSC domain-containing protein [Candidatus Nitrotoga sp.]RFC38793.1 MAG: MOSC domain-containing protein YiiM [Candidatus Nitrotoga sp. CP45]
MNHTDIQLLSIQVGLPKTLGTPNASNTMDQEWTTGFFKETVLSPIWVGTTNLAGDGQADLRVHGGPDKAINVYPFEHYAFWLAELDCKELPNGAFGENFTVAGILETKACIGDIFELGDALVQISQPRQPCWKLSRRWRVQDLVARVVRTGKTGWYFRVLREGNVQAGAALALVERPYPEWTVATANNVMLHRKENYVAAQALADCPALSGSWKATLSRTTATDVAADTSARNFQ